MPDLADVRSRLESMLAELQHRLTHIARDLDEPLHRDWDEQAVEMEDDEALEHQGILIEREIASVQRALGRIRDGSYGICVRCGEEIAPQRLDARPEAALCIGCAQSTM